MNDEEDLKKLINLINKKKQENLDDFQYEEFINCDESDVEDVNYDGESAVDEDYTFLDPVPVDITNLYKYDPISSLRSDEINVIDSCADPILRKILLLNRNKNMQLIQFYKKIKDLLIECKQNIIEKNVIVKKYVDTQKKNYLSSGTWKLGAPYFKDDKFYFCPPNKDTERKRANRELFIYEMYPLPKWKNIECKRLLGAVKVNYNMNQQAEIKNKIKDICLGRKCSHEGDDKILDELQKRLQELKDDENSEVPDLNSDDNINWDRIAEVFIKDKHSAFECRSFWRMFLHPSINKSPWTVEENNELQKIAKRYNYQNWAEIAKELGTNRSGLTACINFYSSTNTTLKKGEFTFAEDRKLLELINRYKLGTYIPWVKIVRHFKNRSRSQLHHRYTYCLSQSDKKKGKWTQAEDIVLMICVDKFGKVFNKCAQYLPHRSLPQCKSRYSSNLMKSLKKGTWSVEEDRAIVDHVASSQSCKWSGLVERLSRCRGQLRQRHQVIEAFLKAHPDKTVEDVPKRKHGWKNDAEENTFKFMRKIADHYKNLPCIPTVDEIQEILDSNVFDGEVIKTDRKPPPEPKETASADDERERDVDDMLTEVFLHAHESSVANRTQDIREIADEVAASLHLLKVDLEIPENLRGFPLDQTDRLILEKLKSRPRPHVPESYRARAESIGKLVPVNMNNCLGLRSMLKKYLHSKSSDMRILGNIRMHRPWMSRMNIKITKELSKLPAEEKSRVVEDRLLFFKRFLSLFKWPAIVTLEGPSLELKSCTESVELNIRPPVQRTYSKRRRCADIVDETVDNKKLKLAPIVLTPVKNNSVIENLMKDKNKKLFYISNVKRGDNLQTISKEIQLRLSNTKSNSSLVVNSESFEDKPTASCSYTKVSERPSSGEKSCTETSEEVGLSDHLEGDVSDLMKLKSFLDAHKNKADDSEVEEWPMDQ